MQKIRESIKELSLADQLDSMKIVDDMESYFNRQTDHSAIRAAIKAKYGIGIRKTTDENSGSELETYVKGEFTEEVDAGSVSALAIGFGNKIINALATLFTEQGVKFSLKHDSVDELEDEELLLMSQRDNGGFNAAMTDTDKLSIQVGSSAVLVGYKNEGLDYQKLSPADIRSYFGEYIEENGKPRPVNKTDIEDATAVVIRLSQVDIEKWLYLAIFARSETYPQGRYVTYEASSVTNEIPEPYQDGAIEYEIEGKLANPLSYFANKNPEQHLPEYPISILYSGTTNSSDLMPVSTSLYEDDLAINVAASHLMDTSQDAARGTLVIEVGQEGVTKSLPRSLHGAVALAPGQTIDHISHDSSASTNALDVLNGLQTHTASGYSVPDYMVVSEDHALEASSGIALAVKTRPLKKFREYRVEINKPSVKKVFDIEKILISLHYEGDDSAVNTLLESDQIWESGELILPENNKEKAERINMLKEAGLYDEIAAIRELNGFSSDTEAIAEYTRMKDRKNEYPPLNPKEEKKPSLLGRRNVGR